MDVDHKSSTHPFIFVWAQLEQTGVYLFFHPDTQWALLLNKLLYINSWARIFQVLTRLANTGEGEGFGA